MTRVIRWVLTIALMVQVWLHAHWSVALSLTLLSIAAELESQTIRVLIQIIKGQNNR